VCPTVRRLGRDAAAPSGRLVRRRGGSSAGQSMGLIIPGSWVRAPPAPQQASYLRNRTEDGIPHSARTAEHLLPLRRDTTPPVVAVGTSSPCWRTGDDTWAPRTAAHLPENCNMEARPRPQDTRPTRSSEDAGYDHPGSPPPVQQSVFHGPRPRHEPGGSSADVPDDPLVRPAVSTLPRGLWPCRS
jgi:hypothetical protein